ARAAVRHGCRRCPAWGGGVRPLCHLGANPVAAVPARPGRGRAGLAGGAGRGGRAPGWIGRIATAVTAWEIGRGIREASADLEETFLRLPGNSASGNLILFRSFPRIHYLLASPTQSGVGIGPSPRFQSIGRFT